MVMVTKVIYITLQPSLARQIRVSGETVDLKTDLLSFPLCAHAHDNSQGFCKCPLLVSAVYQTKA
jgi:hypothetical protein